MNKTILAVGILVILLLGGGAFWMMNNNKGEKQTNTTSTENSNTNTATTSAPKTLKELMALQTPQSCTFSSSEEGYSSDGTVYYASGKVRGDFETKVENQLTKAHFVNEGNTLYMWMDGQAQGFKMSMETTNEENTETKTQNKQYDPNKQVDYKCSAWNVDSAVFVKPANVEFVDPMEGLKAIPSVGLGSGSKCQACDALSGESKTQCLTALNCN
jgi:hypothetical protein